MTAHPAGTDPLVFAAAVVLAAFLPPLGYMVWLRNTERYHREPWGNMIKAFVWGAVGGVVVALVILSVLDVRPDAAPFQLSPVLFGAVVVAPLVEEFTKGLGLGFIRDDHVEAEDGLVYGAAAGFGFAATENLLYFTQAYFTGGVGGLVATVIVRVIAAALLHGAASSLLGYGLWKRRLGIGNVVTVFGFYLAAVALHAVYNLAASATAFAGLVFALLLALGVAWFLHRRIRGLDRGSVVAG